MRYFFTFCFIFLTLSSYAQENKKIRLALNWKAEPQFGGFYAAELNGSFKAAGLTIEIFQGGSGTPVIQMIAAGNAEVGISSGDQLILSQNQGTDVVALFAVYQTNPQALLVHEESGVDSLEKLWKSRGILAAQSGLPYFSYLTKKYGAPKLKIVPYLGGVANFLADPNYSQQGFGYVEPLQIQKQGGKVKTFLIAEAGYNPYTTVLVARRSWIKKNETLISSLVKAVREGWKSYLKNPQFTNALLVKLNPSMDIQTMNEMAKAHIPYIETQETKRLGLGKMTPVRWQTLIDQLYEIKLISKKPAVSDLFLDY